MKTTENVTRQNKSLEELGRGGAEFGSPQLYRWIWAADLLFPSRVDSSLPTRGGTKQLPSGLWIPTNRYEYAWIRQVLRDVWVLGEWHPPMDPEKWSRMFDGGVQWPAQGLYMDSSLACYRDEPRDGDTAFVKAIVRESRNRSAGERIDAARYRAEAQQKKHVERTADWIDDQLHKYVVTSYPTAGPDRLR